MSSHYLIDLFTNAPKGVVSSGGSPGTQATGTYVVRVDSDVVVQNPVDLSDLLTKKYLGILASQPTFTNIAYDTMLDATGINFSSSLGVFSGVNSTIGLYPTDLINTDPVLITNSESIPWSGLGSGPTQAMLVYETFTFVDVDSATEPYQRYYQELVSGSDTSVEVSFDNGVHYQTAANKTLLSVAGANQGTSLILKFTRTSNVSSVPKVYLGSWAILY
jgi:hypothetical protein